jgi:hypothetical protein
MKGHWTKQIPQVAGRYWTADRDLSMLTGIHVIYQAENGEFMDAGNQHWKGHWWSEPIEVPPLAIPERKEQS